MILRLGSSGPFVQKLQEKLCIKPDGKFGPITKIALVEWQKDNGFIPNGIASKEILQNMGILKRIIEVNFKKLAGHIPTRVLFELVSIAGKFNINNDLRVCHFLSQCSYESGNFTKTIENLNYSAERLEKVFKKYFPEDLALQYAGNPEKIASRVYANRMGNGDESSGDGWRYRGRGYIQLTGKNNYSTFGKYIGDDLVINPDKVSEEYPLTSAAFFFDSNQIWQICDEGDTDEVVRKVTRRVNGGYHGLEKRIVRFKKFYDIIK